jgi:two-component system, sensor histidine kinase and response regulator
MGENSIIIKKSAEYMPKNYIAKVMVVDDNANNLQLLGAALKNNYYNPILVQSGLNALAIAEQSEPDIILLDVMMPGINGFELCEILKKSVKAKEIPVIYITAKTSQDDILHGFSTGAVDYVFKPINIQELIARVKIHVELKKSRDIIKSQNTELSRLNTSKDKLFSIIAHDLRNPFSGIMNFANLFADDYHQYGDEERKEMVKAISKTASQGYRLLENLLDWSRSSSGFMGFNKKEISIKKIIDECIDFMEPFAAQKKIHISADYGNAQQLIMADKEMIATVLRNLVSNAIKFTPQGGTVSVNASLLGDEIVIGVADTGKGIPEADKELIMDFGERHSTSGTEGEQGTGLGLLIVQEFISKHEGRFWFSSAEGKGSVFSFSLPI